MVDKDIQEKQEETLRRLQEFSDKRKTKIIADEEHEAPEVKAVLPNICEFCGDVLHLGQVHGLGYCKEKVQYEQ